MPAETTVTARVRVVVEVVLSQPWSGQETMDYVFETAGKDAVDRVNDMIGDYARARGKLIRRVGDPVVEIVTAKKG